jgi:3-deoxy-D-manno-octulosonic-acid transferase
VRKFSQNSLCLVAGSTWPHDEDLLTTYINNKKPGMKFIIAPHEIDESHIARLIKLLKIEPVLFSKADERTVAQYQVLIIDNIGMLSSVYRYASITYVGGGFGKGIHNILEPAVFGKPVIFGPNYLKFKEAIELIAAGGAFATGTYEEFMFTIDGFIESPDFLETSSARASDYVYGNAGATDKILSFLKKEIKF